jgi:ADP-ribose pyrophosphatase YjhB (NUDIX family)
VWQRRRISAYGLCRDETGRVLLVRGAADDARGIWALPGGGVDHGEHPRAAVIREFAEETGLAADTVRLQDVVSDLAVNPYRQEVVHSDRVIYDVKVTGGAPRHEIDGGSDLAGWFEPAEAAGLPLLPYAARLLDLPLPEGPEIPAAQPRLDPDVTKVQRFAAYGLTTDPAGRILLTRIAARYPGAGTWHLPGGGTDFGEQPTAGLLRELVEETGQLGRVTGLRAVVHYHNPRAMGPEGRAMNWHTVRALYRVEIDEPSTPNVVEAAGGSTAEARWVDRADLAKLPVNGFTKTAVVHHLS